MADPRLAGVDAALRRGDMAAAKSLADAVVAGASVSAADRAQALMLRSRAHEGMKNLAAAIADIEGALALTPRDARAHNELGILCADAGEMDRAIEAFRRATALDAGYARAWNNLGNALRSAGRVEESAAAFARSTEIDPRYALAWTNLGIVQRDLGRDDGAVAAFRRALAVDPRQRLAMTALAGVRRAQGQLDEAAALYAQALALDPRDATSWLLYAGTLAERDDLDEARRAYAEALQRDAKLLRAVFGAALTLPMVPADEAARLAARAAFVQGLQDVERELPARAAALAPEAAIDEMRWTNFLLAYQGEDDKALQQRFATAVGNTLDRVAPAWRAPLARRHRTSRRLRVAFVSAFFREGTVGRYFEHWIRDLPRDAIEVYVYHQQPGRDEVALRLAERADAFRDCPRFRPRDIASRVRADAPDVVVYPELGMDATTFAVAALRLAPLQVVGWGHPVTTGHSTIDVFLTAGAMEPDGAEAHYTERLVRLPGIGTRYARPSVPEPASRASLGLPEGPLFLWPQSLFKITPGDDALLASVMASIPEARVVMFEGRHAALTQKYLARLDRAFAAAGIVRGDRVVVRPQCRHDQYLCINLACDAMLDTRRWSGGNTSLDAIACGLPVVTLPGNLMRARQSAAMLGLAGVPELVVADVADYTAVAARIAREPGWRAALSQRLRDGQRNVFDDRAPIDALVEFLLAEG